jgi:hypothetical protein
MDPMSSQGDLLIPTGTQATAYRGAPVSSRSTSAGARAARARRHGATVAGTLLLALSWGCGDQPFDEGPDQAAVQPDLTQIGTRRGALTFTPYLPFQAGQTASIPQSAQGWCGSTSSHTSPIQNSIDFSWSGCKGEPVLATAGGTVTYVHGDCADNGTKNCFNSGGGTCSCNSGLGNLVVIDHGGGVYSAYAHLNPGSLKVSVGEQVCTGKHIADIGHTGFGSGPHLHFHFQNVAGKIYGTSGATLTFDGFAEASAPVCGSVTSKNTLVTGCAPPSWWCSCIDDLEAQGLLSKTCSAYTNGQTFDRATFAKIVGDALDIESTSAYSGCANPYSDVPDDEWYENYVSALAHLEYGDGVSVWSTSSSKFNPGNSMTRCEGLKVIAEAWDLPPSSKSLPFSDLGDFPAWCLDYAKRALAAGVISSTTGAFGPNEPLTVGGAACMVGKTITANGAPKPPASAFVGCGSACSDECTSAGQKSCVGTSGYRTCGDYDADSCLEWSSTTSCGGGKQCSGAGTCASVTSCGDGSCDGGETQSLCCVDCGCPGGKSCNGSTCVTESFCGDGSCNGSETQGSCCLDCGCPSGKSCNGSTCVTESYCGDGSCNGSETQGSCCLDCGCPGGSSCNGSTCVTESFCGDGSCNGSETQGSCCLDCGCPGGSSCQGTTCVVAPFCGDGSCNGSETQGSCCLDCGCPGGSSCQGSTCVTESFCGDGSCNGERDAGVVLPRLRLPGRLELQRLDVCGLAVLWRRVVQRERDAGVVLPRLRLPGRLELPGHDLCGLAVLRRRVVQRERDAGVVLRRLRLRRRAAMHRRSVRLHPGMRRKDLRTRRVRWLLRPMRARPIL